MSGENLQVLERDVEDARARLTRNLSTLRSPNTMTQFTDGLKQEALDAKDAMIENVKTSMQSSVQTLVDDLKAKAAANPAAVLAIGAGIAWRLMRNPPITTVLIGAGLYSLWRTTPQRRQFRAADDYLTEAKLRLREQASEFAGKAGELAGQAADKASELAGQATDRLTAQASDLAGKASDMAVQAKDNLAAQASGLANKAGELADETRDRLARQASDFAESVTGTSERASISAKVRAAEIAGAAQSRVNAWSTEASERLRHASSEVREHVTLVPDIDQEIKDKLLLGTAGLAVAAALGFAYQRRLTERDTVD